jgi:hypothetical protein
LIDEAKRVSDQLKLSQTRYDEQEQFYSTEKIRYEKQIKEISKRPTMTCVKSQTVKICYLN